MFSLVFAATVFAGPSSGCHVGLEERETVVERRTLKVRDGEFEAVALSRPDEWSPVSRMLVLGSDCKPVFSQRFEDAAKIHFSTTRLGGQPILFVTAYRPGGSGAGFNHTLLAYGGEMFFRDGIQPLAPTSLDQSNMDGIFVGDLGHGRGAGLVLWNAQWNGQEAHYEPHRYQIVTYRWRDGRFVGPAVTTTARKYNAEPNEVARLLGLGLRDMTEQSRFGWRN